MKKASAILLMLLFTNGFAQSPLDFSEAGIDYLFEEYAQGLDEAFYTPQVSRLKGKIRSCVIERIILEPEPKAEGPNKSNFFYQLSYAFNADYRLSELEINAVNKPYRKEAGISKRYVRQGFVWEGSRLKLTSFFDVDVKSTSLAIMRYHADSSLHSQEWFRSSNGVFVDAYPISVNYRNLPDGGVQVTGKVKRDDDSIVKFTQTFDNRGRMMKRCIYNRSLRPASKNNPADAEVFDYQYNEQGQVTSLSYTKGNSRPIYRIYHYKDPDPQGNYRIQQVLDKDQKILYEIRWKMQYEN